MVSPHNSYRICLATFNSLLNEERWRLDGDFVHIHRNVLISVWACMQASTKSTTKHEPCVIVLTEIISPKMMTFWQNSCMVWLLKTRDLKWIYLSNDIECVLKLVKSYITMLITRIKSTLVFMYKYLKVPLKTLGNVKCMWPQTPNPFLFLSPPLFLTPLILY